MKATQVALQQLLDGKPQYRVPLFQRTYSWEEDEWDRLWTDVLEIYMMEHPRNHFIGAVVTQPISDAAGEATKYLLIDGQQRLTTLFIMLACIRGKISRLEEPSHLSLDELSHLSEEIWETCLVNKFAPSVEDFVKLRPTQADREHFTAVVNNEDLEGASQVLSAYGYFSRRIDDGDLEGNPLDFRRLKSCITDRLDLVSITLETEDSPHRIFESLNNTGMQLGPSDLVRNLIFMNISGGKEAQIAYEKYWFPMQDTTQKKTSQRSINHLDDFFWRYLMMNGSLPRWDETFEEVRLRFGNGGTEKALEMLIEFSKFSRYYRWLREIEEPQDSLRQQIKRLNTWQVDVAYSFLMRSLDWMEEERISSNDIVNVMKMIESFVVRRAVCSIPTNRLRSIFARMPGQVAQSNFVASSRDYLLGERWPSDEEFKDAFTKFHLYSRARLARTRLILESLEDSFGSKEPAKITEDITVEHIMPQSLSSEWTNMLGPNVEEVHQRWLHTPGNLTLTGYNPELGNASFQDKKGLLESSKFSLTHGVLKHEWWGEDTIKARGEALAERAVQIWKR